MYFEEIKWLVVSVIVVVGIVITVLFGINAYNERVKYRIDSGYCEYQMIGSGNVVFQKCKE